MIWGPPRRYPLFRGIKSNHLPGELLQINRLAPKTQILASHTDTGFSQVGPCPLRASFHLLSLSHSSFRWGHLEACMPGKPTASQRSMSLILHQIAGVWATPNPSLSPCQEGTSHPVPLCCPLSHSLSLAQGMGPPSGTQALSLYKHFLFSPILVLTQ